MGGTEVDRDEVEEEWREMEGRIKKTLKEVVKKKGK